MDTVVAEPDQRRRLAAGLPLMLLMGPALLLDVAYTGVLFKGLGSGPWRWIGNVLLVLGLVLTVSTPVVGATQIGLPRLVRWARVLIVVDTAAVVALACALVPLQPGWFWAAIFGPQLLILGFAWWALRGNRPSA